MPPLAGSRAVLILGTHRSGTSCVARIVNLLGVDLGSNLLPPRPDNPTGFWEHAEISRIHEQLLGHLGRTWQSAQPLPASWWEGNGVAPYRAEIKATLERDFAASRLWGIKEPRLCSLLPLWLEILAECGCEAEVLLVLRDAREVASSLLVRDGIPEWRSNLMWLRHVLDAERDSRGCRRALVQFNDVVRDWRTAFKPVIQLLDVPEWGDENAAEIDRFIQPQLRHHDSSVSPDPPRTKPPWLEAAVETLAAHGELDSPQVAEALSGLSRELQAADAVFAPWRDQVESALGEYRLIIENAAHTNVALQDEGELLRTLLSETRREQDEVKARSAANVRDARERLRYQEERLAQIRHVRDQLLIDVGDRDARIRRLEAEVKQRDQLLIAVGERDARIRRLEDEVKQRDQLLIAVGERDARIRELDAQVDRLEGEVKQRDRTLVEVRRSDAEHARDLSTLREEFTRTHSELTAHQAALGGVLASRSWRITRPLRWLSTLIRGGAPLFPGGFDARHLTPWCPLLPDHPFEQSFGAPSNEFQKLAIYFYTYRRANTSTVKVQLFEERRLGRHLRQICEVELSGDEIQDGRASVVRLPRLIDNARARRFRISIRQVDGSPDESVTVALTRAYYPGRILSSGPHEESQLLAMEFDPDEGTPRSKAFAIVSGCPGDAYRYRCVHVSEMLALSGYSADLYPADVFRWDELVGPYQAVILHRVPHTSKLETFVAQAAQRGVRVLFDTDDLVFDLSVLPQIAALRDMDRAQRKLYEDGVRRYGQTLALCHGAMVSTPALVESVNARFPEMQVELSRNCMSDAMEACAEEALSRPRSSGETVQIGYLSGTPTHRLDFQECVPALAQVLGEFPSARLLLVGHVDVPPELAEHRGQIEQKPLVSWSELPQILRDLDVNLAPLERGGEFTGAKSELKWFEAGLLGVPTVASSAGAFQDTLVHGENGFLCEGTDDWVAALRALIQDAELRARVGARAREGVRERYLTRPAAVAVSAAWKRLVEGGKTSHRKLVVSFVLRAPIADTGGGYKKIFLLAHHLADAGHDVHLYVEPIAHLKGKSVQQIREFCAQHFGSSAATVHRGHEAIVASDVAVATNWPTAPVVAALENARLRAYFIQDHEADFYESSDPLHRAAERTYDLPLLMISIGRYLAQRLGERNRMTYPWVDFALAPVFFDEAAAVQAKLRSAPDAQRLSVLFFARPEIPRRGFADGVEALKLLHEAEPDVKIRLYGMKERARLPFPYENLGVVDQSGVARAMRESTIHLSLSRTNASTVIFEAMASGCVAVDLDGAGVRSLIDDPETCILADDRPDALAKQLIDLVRNPTRRQAVARAGLKAAQGLTVENMCRGFERILLERALLTDLPPHTAEEGVPDANGD